MENMRRLVDAVTVTSLTRDGDLATIAQIFTAALHPHIPRVVSDYKTKF